MVDEVVVQELSYEGVGAGGVELRSESETSIVFLFLEHHCILDGKDVEVEAIASTFVFLLVHDTC